MRNFTLLLALFASAAASAQVFTAPALGQTLQWRTDNGLNSFGNGNQLTPLARGVGFDAPGGIALQFPTGYGNAANAKSVTNTGIALTALPAGSRIQLGIHGYAINRVDPTAPVLLSVKLYRYDPTFSLSPDGAGALLATMTAGWETTAGTIQADRIRYTTQGVLSEALAANDKYVLAFDGAPVRGQAAGAVNAMVIYGRNFAGADPFTRNYSLFRGTTFQGTFGADVNQAPVGYRFFANPVPEPASMAVLALGLAALKRRRRNA